MVTWLLIHDYTIYYVNVIMYIHLSTCTFSKTNGANLQTDKVD